MDEIMAAIEHGRPGDREFAAATLTALWDAVGDDALADDGYGAMIRSGITSLQARLAA